MNKGSYLFRELTEAEIRAVSEQVLPKERVVEYELLKGGLFNTTYKIETDKSRIVLRVGPVNRELLLPFEHNLMAAECEVDRICERFGIPASEVICCDTSKSIIDRDFMAVRYIESVPLSSEAVPKEVVPKLQEECGTYLRKLHNIKGNGFGRVSQVLSGNGNKTWSEALIFEFESLFASGKERNVFSDEVISKAMELVLSEKTLLDKVTVPSLAHADLWAGNVLVREETDGWHVCAIIDGDRAFWGDPEFDLVTPWMVTPAFLRGYGPLKSVFSEEERQRKNRVMRLLLSLTDAYVWKVEYANEEEYLKNLAAAKKLMGEKR
ncbi:MAG: aminoglycoside phosphotransferase family protein [Clostridia bacterium]|nr:aminoglycoside phosphotransferase family protein [Clostridia bacterium]